ncbi:hypothetical protein DSO57_1031029 [Entomophthora muscae]|uniref:Uncharacterized protein n=1 Tax=Entomophthora muscae TaxID=34485 RepID=A0ACC2S2V5_9FUNG|nr:hypothetical protein DSO57_1031029 [Entomophthora muscae]
MFSSPAVCCLCIDQRSGSIIISLLQVVGALVITLTQLADAINGQVRGLAGTALGILLVVFNLRALKGVFQRKEKSVRALSQVLLVHLFVVGFLIVTQLIAVIYFGTQSCYTGEKLDGDCDIPEYLGIGIFVLALVFVFKLHCFRVTCAYANTLAQEFPDKNVAVPAIESTFLLVNQQ